MSSTLFLFLELQIIYTSHVLIVWHVLQTYILNTDNLSMSHPYVLMTCFLASGRFLKLENNERSLTSSSALESQPAKRQKLEGGHLRKVKIYYNLHVPLNSPPCSPQC